MGVDVGCGGNVAVSQPLLNLLQAHTIGIQKTRTAMPEIMKTNPSQIVFLQQVGEMLRQIAGFHQLTDFVDIDVVQILFAVRPATELPVHLLLRFHPEKQFLKGRHQRQRPIAGFRFGAVLLHNHAFPVFGKLCHGMADGDGLVFKVNRVPFQTDYLTPAQTIECGDNDGKFNRVTLA